MLVYVYDSIKKLSQDDIDGIQYLYVKNNNRIPSIPTTTATITTTIEKVKDYLPPDLCFISPDRYLMEIKCNAKIDFINGSIGSLLGFKEKLLQANIKHISNYPVNISKIN